MLTSRLLPRSEWPKLDQTELGRVWLKLPPTAAVLVVEDAAEIVGCWAVLPVWHAEGLWVHPDYRRQGGVLRRLWRLMRRQSQAASIPALVTAATSPDVEDLLARTAGQRLPGVAYLWPTQKGLMTCPPL